MAVTAADKVKRTVGRAGERAAAMVVESLRQHHLPAQLAIFRNMGHDTPEVAINPSEVITLSRPKDFVGLVVGRRAITASADVCHNIIYGRQHLDENHSRRGV